jgi:hypothetical protein
VTSAGSVFPARPDTRWSPRPALAPALQYVPFTCRNCRPRPFAAAEANVWGGVSGMGRHMPQMRSAGPPPADVWCEPALSGSAPAVEHIGTAPTCTARHTIRSRHGIKLMSTYSHIAYSLAVVPRNSLQVVPTTIRYLLQHR